MSKWKPETIGQFLEKRATAVPESGCWLWNGYTFDGRYGGIERLGRRELAHRVAYELAFGPIPDGIYVCHKCDVPLCVNPNHLFLGTPADNSGDMVRKNRQAQGTRARSAKLTEVDVAAIRSSPFGSWKLGRQYGVTKRAIVKIKRRISWKGVA
jgi:hypothetical protein